MHTHPEIHRALADIRRREIAAAVSTPRPAPSADSRWVWMRRARVVATPPAATATAPHRAEGCSTC